MINMDSLMKRRNISAVLWIIGVDLHGLNQNGCSYGYLNLLVGMAKEDGDFWFMRYLLYFYLQDYIVNLNLLNLATKMLALLIFGIASILVSLRLPL